MDLHGFTEEQLGDLAKFMKGQGGFEAFKARMSNPDKFKEQEPAQPVQPQNPTQSAQPQESAQPNVPPKGYVSRDEINTQIIFERLSQKPEYANISDYIASGEVLKEMDAMGMHPVDGNFNINMDQLNKFLAMKSASVPAKQTSVEPTNIPTVEYVSVENNTITSSQQALDVLRQSMELRQKGQAPHPAEAKAQQFLHKNGF